MKSMRARYPLVSVLYLALLFAANWQATAQTNQFSGTIQMPQGVVPVSSSATFRIQTVPVETFRLSDGQSTTTSAVVTIPRFESSATFSFPLRDVNPTTPLSQRQRKLQFECLSGCANIAITSVGFLSLDQGVVAESDASEFDSAIAQNRSIVLERGDLFTGVIQFPEGIEATGDEVFTVQILGSQFVSPSMFEQQVSADAGQTRWAFFVGVPPDETGGSWSLNLNCEMCPSELQAGTLFASTRSGDPLVFESDQRFSYVKNRNYSNIRLSFIEEESESNSALPAIISLLLDEE